MRAHLTDSPRYRWVILAICFLMVFICLGLCSSTKSLFLAAITGATGMKRSLFSISDSVRYITTAVVNLFFGTLIARFGGRKLIAAGFAALIAFALIFSFADAPWQFCVGGFFLGVGLSWTTTSMVGHVVNAWFQEGRGTVMGVILASNGLGAALAAQIISPIIYDSGDVFGYRTAYRLTAAALLAAGVIVLLLYREHPKGAAAASPAKKKKRGMSWRGIPLAEALRTPYVYAAAAAVFLTGMSLQGITTSAVAHLKDVGLDADYIALLFSFYSLALAACKVGVGFLYDHIGLRRTILLCDLAGVGAILMLVVVTPTAQGRVIAAAYFLLAALALPLETIILPLLTAELFGDLAYEKLLGIVVSVNTAGYALGAPMTNLCYDVAGTYVPVMIALSAVMAAVTVAFRFILRAADRTRARVEAEQA